MTTIYANRISLQIKIMNGEPRIELIFLKIVRYVTMLLF